MSDIKYNENKPHGKSSGTKMTLEELKKNAAQDKVQIDALKKAILNKVKSNGVAKKAALIISNWIEKDGKKQSGKDSNTYKKSA